MKKKKTWTCSIQIGAGWKDTCSNHFVIGENIIIIKGGDKIRRCISPLIKSKKWERADLRSGRAGFCEKEWAVAVNVTMTSSISCPWLLGKITEVAEVVGLSGARFGQPLGTTLLAYVCRMSLGPLIITYILLFFVFLFFIIIKIITFIIKIKYNLRNISYNFSNSIIN